MSVQVRKGKKVLFTVSGPAAEVMSLDSENGKVVLWNDFNDYWQMRMTVKEACALVSALAKVIGVASSYQGNECVDGEEEEA